MNIRVGATIDHTQHYAYRYDRHVWALLRLGIRKPNKMILSRMVQQPTKSRDDERTFEHSRRKAREACAGNGEEYVYCIVVDTS